MLQGAQWMVFDFQNNFLVAHPAATLASDVSVRIVDVHNDVVAYAMLAATWFAAAGTVGAVWLSLRESKKASRKSLVIRTAMISGGLLVTIYNDGAKALTVRNVSYLDRTNKRILGPFAGPPHEDG